MEFFPMHSFVTPGPLTSLKQNGCYCDREGFLCAGISEDELRYSRTASFQKTIRQTSTYKAVCLTTGARNFNKRVAYVKVKFLGDHQYQRKRWS